MSPALPTTIRRRATWNGRALVAALALVGIGGVLAGCGGSANTTPSKGAYAVRAIFDSAAFVLPGLDVRVSGVKVGEVNAIELTDDNKAAVTFTINDPGFKDFRKDATCTIRPQALIGERYLSCELTQPRPAGAVAPPALPTIKSGDLEGQHVLPVSQTFVPVDPDQLISANTPSVRERLFLIVRELGAGVAGRGDKINAALRKSNEGLRYANQILRQLDEQTEMLRQLSTGADTTLASLAAERASVSGTIESGAVVARRLAARQVQVRAAIANLNTLLGEVGPSVDKVTELTTQLKPIASDLNASSADLASVINDLPGLSSRGSAAITPLGNTLAQGRTLLTSAETNALIDRLVKTAAGVKSTGSDLGLTLADLRQTGGLDYLLDAIYGLAYATNGRDANGSYLRAATINASNCALPANAKSDACGRLLSVESTVPPKQLQAASGDASAARAGAASPDRTSSSSAATGAGGLSATQSKAADLLFGGGR